MTLALTQEILAAAYTYLLVTPPFCSWNLPPAAKIKFSVTGHFDRRADCWDAQGSRTNIGIRVSRRYVGFTCTLLETMAHEMIHVRQYVHKLDTANTKHNAAFHKDARAICKHHGFDPKAFA